jgi:hypothetical protein
MHTNEKLFCSLNCRYLQRSWRGSYICKYRYMHTGNIDDRVHLLDEWSTLSQCAIPYHTRETLCPCMRRDTEPVERTSVLTLSFTLPAEKNAYDIAAHAMGYAQAWRHLKEAIKCEAESARIGTAEYTVLLGLQDLIAEIEQDYTLPRPE